MRSAEMKRNLIMLFCIAGVLLTACARYEEMPAEVTPTPETITTPVPTPTPEPTPRTTAGTVRILKAPAIIETLCRGDEVLITGEQGEFYTVDSPAGSGLVEKRLLATEADERFEKRKGYAYASAKLYADYRLIGAIVAELNLNDELTLIADLNGCYLADFNGTMGYISSDMVSDTQTTVYYDYGGGGGSNGGGGGDAGGGAAPAGGADGGDIALGYQVKPSAALVFLSDTAKPQVTPGSKAQVISLEAELIAAFYDMGDEVRIASVDGESCVLYIDGVHAKMEKRFLELDGESADEPKEGYANSNTNLYDNYYLMLNDSAISLTTNSKLTILADLNDCYFVSTENGDYGYVEKSIISDAPVVIYYDYGGGGGGGSTDGGGSSGGGAEWTEPAL